MSDHIEHHGIKGQRWGIRRTPEQLGHDRKPVKDMSDDYLRKNISRLRMEKEYKQLMKELHPDKNDEVEEFIKKCLSGALKGISAIALMALKESWKMANNGKKSDNSEKDNNNKTENAAKSAKKGEEYINSGFMSNDEMEKYKWVL